MTTSDSTAMLAIGAPVLFVDRRQRRHYDLLAAGGVTNIRGALISHDDVLGQPDGIRVRSNKGTYFNVLSATLRQHVLNMPRHAQIVYPKDLAILSFWADLRPDLRVVEGGFGSGALSMTILRAIGERGHLTTYELQEAPANRAAKNVAIAMGDVPHHTVKIADIYDGIDERDVDRIILDVPEPWDVVPHALTALRPGGIFASYVPTAIQLHRLSLALARSGGFVLVEQLETMLRPWLVRPRSVRPESKMIAHTGFLVFARRVEVPTPGLVDDDGTDGRAAEAD